MTRLVLALLVLMVLVSGCAETRQYQVAVRNDTDQPMTVWLTKNGPPYEPGWYAPEEFAVSEPGRMDPIPGAVVQPGEELETDVMKGKFNADTEAVLRVYPGQLKFAEILATARSERMDVQLRPGLNELVVSNADDGGLVVEWAEP